MSAKKSDAAASIDLNQEVTEVMKSTLEENDKFAQGLANIGKIKVYDEEKWPVVPYSEFNIGTIALKSSYGSSVVLEFGCGQAQVRTMSCDHFVAALEGSHDEREATILTQNFSDGEHNKSSRGQVSVQLSLKHSALIVYQGMAGKVIRTYQDIALREVYYLKRGDLLAMYLAAKFQIANRSKLDKLASANQAWKAFNVPLDLTRPYDARI